MSRWLHVEREILIYAFRYSLGRMTFAPTNVIEAIKDNIRSISSNDIRLFMKEIKECESYGMDMDKENWLSFHVYLQNILNERTNDNEQI